tara:strand:- start:1991 stop:2191 length:201 start_codon:yes stop_codon:yes gene_type:complete
MTDHLKPLSKQELCELYGIARPTFRKWIKPFLPRLQEMGYTPSQKILTISQVKYLFSDDVLGTPNT